jgi:hypothetical protein
MLPPETAFGDPKNNLPSRTDDEIQQLLTEWRETDGVNGGEGRTMKAISHAAKLSLTPVISGSAPMELSKNLPEWP